MGRVDRRRRRLSARRGVLEVVPSRVLRHPGAFDERSDRGVSMVHAETFPSVLLRIETEQPPRRPLIVEMLGLIELDHVQRIHIRRIPVKEPTVRLRIVKERGIPWTRLHRVWLGERAGFVLARHRQPRKKAIVELDAPRRRLREHENR